MRQPANYLANPKSRMLIGVILWLLFALLLIRPSLSGSFLMDDFSNLHGLADVAAHPDARQIIEFSLSGFSGPTGRPLSLLSFALQAAAGHADVGSLKYVNALIHLLNGCLLLLLWLELAPRMSPDKSVQLGTCLTVFALWLVHPLQVTAVAYVIQRMTSLSATFILLALIGYVTGRRIAHRNHAIGGTVLAACSLGLGGTLAILAKETGVLTLVYALVIEYTLFVGDESPRIWSWFKRFCIFLPTLLVIAIVVYKFDALVLDGYKVRNYGLGGRLLTEPRVIWDYLGNILAPSPRSLGLFHDDYRASTGLLSPWSTIPALLGVMALCTAAAVLRKSAPVLAFGISWFIGGHLLESTVFPLELYYEHRNYLPLAGILTLAAFYVPILLRKIDSTAIRAAIALSAIVLMTEIIAASYVTYLYWGQPLTQSKIWAKDHPASVRAQIRLASAQIMARLPEESERTLKRLEDQNPDDIAGAMTFLHQSCNTPGRDIRWAVRVLSRAPHADFNLAPVVALIKIVTEKEAGYCKAIPSLLAMRTVTALLANPKFRGQAANLYLVRGRLAFNSGNSRRGLADFDAAFAIKSDPAILMRASQKILDRGDADLASIIYLRAMQAFTRHPVQSMTWAHEMKILKSALANSPAYEHYSLRHQEVQTDPSPDGPPVGG